MIGDLGPAHGAGVGLLGTSSTADQVATRNIDHFSVLLHTDHTHPNICISISVKDYNDSLFFFFFFFGICRKSKREISF